MEQKATAPDLWCWGTKFSGAAPMSLALRAKPMVTITPGAKGSREVRGDVPAPCTHRGTAGTATVSPQGARREWRRPPLRRCSFPKNVSISFQGQTCLLIPFSFHKHFSQRRKLRDPPETGLDRDYGPRSSCWGTHGSVLGWETVTTAFQSVHDVLACS